MCSVTQSCLILCDPIDCSLPGSSVHGFSRQEYWNRLPFPTPGYLPASGIEPVSLASPALAVGFWATREADFLLYGTSKPSHSTYPLSQWWSPRLPSTPQHHKQCSSEYLPMCSLRDQSNWCKLLNHILFTRFCLKIFSKMGSQFSQCLLRNIFLLQWSVAPHLLHSKFQLENGYVSELFSLSKCNFVFSEKQ